MSGFPLPQFIPNADIILSTMGFESLGSMPIIGGGITTFAWPSSNLAIYVPIRVTAPFTFNTLACALSVGTNNVDLGVYTEDGTKIISTGSQASGTNINSFSVTTTEIGPGLFYLAMASSGTTLTPYGYSMTATAKVGLLRAVGVSQQATALPLPATASFAANTGGVVPLIAMTSRSFI